VAAFGARRAPTETPIMAQQRHRDITLTESAADVPPHAARRTAAGVLVAFCEQAGPRAIVAVEEALTFGREEPSRIVLRDPGVSRVHAQIEPAPGGVRVTDLGSHNGTFVNGARVSDPAHAAFGSVVRMAKTLLVVVEEAAAFEAAARPDSLGLVGGPGLDELRLRVLAIAGSSAPVLVEGETGTGKELVARAIHEASGREGSLVALNCAAIASELVESELFGHGRGAFSGAQGARAGLFRTAHRGTLLLDEISELRPAVQAKLLRALESGEVRAVGEDRPASVDVRVVAATNRDLRELLRVGEFRADLYHRVAALRIRVPPLRQRPEDVAPLCEHFLEGEGVGVTALAMEALLVCGWPGNVRQLRNVVHAAAAAARFEGRDRISESDVRATEPGDQSDRDEPRARIAAALSATGGNVTRAAAELGMARSGLYEALRRLGIDPLAFRKR
jgi:DNA-binding NtrC family response regulator